MNWYKLYIGDYRRKTAHLSLSEHGAYKILLDHYYATGEPLPHDITALCRIVSAQTDEERQAVSKVADEFFPPNGDGRRHNKRADEELSQYAETVEHNRRVGRLGGRPRKPGNNPSGFENETRNKPEWVPGNNPNQKLETRSQNTEVQIPETINPIARRFARFWAEYPKKKGKGEAEKVFKQIHPDDQLLDRMLASVAASKNTPQWQKDGGEFIPYPARWLRGKRWDDEVEQFLPNGKSKLTPCEWGKCSNGGKWRLDAWDNRLLCEQHYMQAKRGDRP